MAIVCAGSITQPPGPVAGKACPVLPQPFVVSGERRPTPPITGSQREALRFRPAQAFPSGDPS